MLPEDRLFRREEDACMEASLFTEAWGLAFPEEVRDSLRGLLGLPEDVLASF